MSSTKQTTASHSKNPYAGVLEKLDKASEALEGATSSHALWFNYTLWKEELDLQKKELKAKWMNAEAEFQHRHELKSLDLKLKETEECSIAHPLSC